MILLKSEAAIRREIARIRKAQGKPNMPATVRAELYGALQALSWALESDVMAPATCAMLSMPKSERDL